MGKSQGLHRPARGPFLGQIDRHLGVFDIGSRFRQFLHFVEDIAGDAGFFQAGQGFKAIIHHSIDLLNSFVGELDVVLKSLLILLKGSSETLIDSAKCSRLRSARRPFLLPALNI